MAIVANTYLTYDAKGIREDLTDAIYMISPDETPFLSMIGRSEAKQTLHEWQIDALGAAVSTNAQLEGDDITSFAAVTPTTRLGNHMQISRKTLIVSGTEEVVNKAGRKSDFARETAKRGKELRLDMETTVLSLQAAVGGASGTARKTGGLLAFIKTNDDFGAGGASPVYTTLPNAERTDGTQRAITETIHKNVIQLCWTAGVVPKTVMTGAHVKTVISGFSGVASKTFQINSAKPGVTVASADVYVSDFGTLSVIPNRNQRGRDAFYVSPEYASIAFLRPFFTKKLATTGDAEKRALIVEWGLKVNHEGAFGLAADLSTS